MHPLTVNLRHLVKRELHLEGELPANELGLNGLDEMIQIPGVVQYDLMVQKMGQALLVQGRLTTQLECQCVRCLKAFSLAIDLPEFSAQLPLEGEEAVPVEGDYVDLTPFLREDIVLAFPQHPLCEAGCAGLKRPPSAGSEAQPIQESQMTSSAWAVLNKLKL